MLMQIFKAWYQAHKREIAPYVITAFLLSVFAAGWTCRGGLD